MKLAVAVILIALVGSARADDDPFAMLREPERAWTFELVTGPSLEALAVVKGAPQTRCRVAALAPIGAVARSRIECAALAEATGEVATALAQRFTLAFEPTGVREMVIESDEPAVLAEATNAGAFTFPRKLARRWSYDIKRPDGAHAVVAVREAPAPGAPGTWWIAEASYTGPSRQGAAAPPVRAAAAFAPGVGPALKCTVGRAAGAARYTCLRLIADPASATRAPSDPPRPKPIATIAITGKTAHNKSSLSAAAVAAKIAASYVPAIRRCYGELLRKQPTAGGGLQLDFTVNAVGKLSEPAAKSAVAGLDSLASCVRGAMAAWQFAIPQSEYGEPRTARFVIDLRLAPPAL
jgi:hypothetical protein